ncbi:uncharacterized protein LOC120459725 isoform X1, partial [Tachysurus ichikawai]
MATASDKKRCNPACIKRTWQQIKMKYKHNLIRKKAGACKAGGGPAPPPLTNAEEMSLNPRRPVAEGIPGGLNQNQSLQKIPEVPS